MKKSELNKRMREAEINNLCKVFEKYDFFNDEGEITEGHGVLLDIYSALNVDTKDKIRDMYYMKNSAKKENDIK